ncbi:MAG: hypothetical protein AB1489_30455 [Acidobacteriota bacterium]
MLLRLSRSILGFVFLMMIFAFTAAEADAVTLVFVHGKGSSKPTIDDLRNNYWTVDMLRASSRNNTVPVLLVNYDGRLRYWDAAADVSAQVNNYLNANPNERLVFITHSYGGVIMRWILCNADSTDPYFNYQGANYNRIQAATSHVITLAGPHAGSEAANVAATLDSSILTGWILTLLDQNHPSTLILTTSNMSYANQNWLRDNLRSKGFYTVAGYGLFNDFAHAEDYGCAAVSGVAGLPGEDDGLVAQYSAHQPGAPGLDWYNTEANHHHNRRNDYRKLGDIIATYGY